MRRAALLFGILIAAVTVSACDDVSGVTTPSPSTAHTSVLAASFVLRGLTVARYTHTSTNTLDPRSIAGAEPSPDAVVAELATDHFNNGAEVVYTQPEPAATVTPFYEVRSAAYVFDTATGASAFYRAELARNDVAAPGGRLNTVTPAPTANTDSITILQDDLPNDIAGAPPARAFFALARRGRVVVRLFGRVNQSSTTLADFLALLHAQDALLASGTD